MTDIPTDAFDKWHPDKAAAFPAQAVDVIHYLQDALAQCRAADESPSIDLAQAQRRWDEAADEIESLRAEVARAQQYELDQRAEVERLKAEHAEDVHTNMKLWDRVVELEGALAEGCIDSEFVRLRAEVERCHARLEIDHYYEGPDMVRVDTTAEERKTFPDGITVRDCTIKLQEEELERLRATRAKK